MYFTVLQYGILSIIIIIMIHNMYDYFKSTLTIPIVKDLVNDSSDTYKNIYNTLQKPPQKDELADYLNNITSNIQQEPQYNSMYENYSIYNSN